VCGRERERERQREQQRESESESVCVRESESDEGGERDGGEGGRWRDTGPKIGRIPSSTFNWCRVV